MSFFLKKHVQDPAQGNRKANMLGSFYFKLFPLGGPEVDRDNLEDTKEAGGAKRHLLAHSG